MGYHSHYSCRFLVQNPIYINHEEPTQIMTLIGNGKVLAAAPLLLRHEAASKPMNAGLRLLVLAGDP